MLLVGVFKPPAFLPHLAKESTGYELVSGHDLATAASQGLSTKMEFTDISEEEAKNILAEQKEISESEKQYLLEYYALVREGKANYVATHAFRDVTKSQPQGLEEFFKSYGQEFKPSNKRRKVSASEEKATGGEEKKADAGKKEGGNGNGNGKAEGAGKRDIKAEAKQKVADAKAKTGTA